VPVGIALGNFLGGLGNTVLGWRMTFLLVGAPGVALAALVYFTIKEPPRGHADSLSPRAGSADAPPMMEVARLLWRRTAFRHMCLGAALHASVWYGGSLWNNAYFQRTHDMTAAEAGSWIGAFALIGMIGTFFGGYLCDKLSIRYNDQRWYMWLPGIATLIILPFAAIAYLGPNMNWIAPAFSIKVILASVFFGPSFWVTQSIATLRTRAVATSLLLFTQTLIGLGLGPLFVGYISDYLEPSVGARSLSYALAIMALTNLWAAGHYFWGARTLRADLAATARMNEEAAR
jgi:predicted MFS family arabinose efflux permease